MGKQASSSSSATSTNPQVKKAAKAHYPISKFDGKSKRRSTTYGLTELVKDICTDEEEALKPIFVSTDNAKNNASKQAIYEILTDILHKLPTELEDRVATLTPFHPELSKKERATIAAKKKRLDQLRQFSQQLTSYEENPLLLTEAEGLWFGKVPEHQGEVSTSVHVKNTSERYLSILDSIETSCDKILEFSTDCGQSNAVARKAQENLYDGFNSVSSPLFPDQHIYLTLLINSLPFLFSI